MTQNSSRHDENNNDENDLTSDSMTPNVSLTRMNAEWKSVAEVVVDPLVSDDIPSRGVLG